MKKRIDILGMYFYKAPSYFNDFVLKAITLIGLLGGFILIYDLSFYNFQYFLTDKSSIFNWYIHALFALLSFKMSYSYFYVKSRKIPKTDLIFWASFLILIIFYYYNYYIVTDVYIQLKKLLIALIVFLLFIFEASKSLARLEKLRLNTGLIFTGSFVFLILAGAFLLMAPNSSYKGVNFINALFTSTSAVCVTGLTVLDTAKDFTRFGQIVILFLIQIGGLGIMTFTGILSYILSGNTSLQNQLILKDMMNANNSAEVFSFIKKIIVGTLLIEAIGAMLIYINIDNNAVPGGTGEKLFFSIFHAVSSFCNAGFSTRTDNLYDVHLRYNYPFITIISFLIILGGIGFPIMTNIYRYIKLHLIQRFQLIAYNEKIHHIPRLIHIQTYLVILTTSILLIFGTVAFYFLEYNSVLREHTTFIGKLVTSFLGSVTPRTAGFNTVNMGDLRITTILITFLLMWIGASPASTGGGIKTTTFAIATLHYFNAIRGKTKIEFMRREISAESVGKALAVISLSFVVIGTSVFMISYFEETHDKFLLISFEVFSAFSTVGLSLNFTSQLSDPSRIVIILTMLIGRVGIITILSGFIPVYTKKSFQYPKEDIII